MSAKKNQITLFLTLRGNRDVKRKLRDAEQNAHRFGKSLQRVSALGSHMGGVFTRLSTGLWKFGIGLKNNALWVLSMAASIPTATYALGKLGLKFATIAADAKEVRSLFLQAFPGEATMAMDQAIQRLVRNLGLSKSELEKHAALMAVFGSKAGLQGQELAKFADQLLWVGADLTAAYNTSFEDAMAAIKSGLSGETEPLKQFGIIMTEADLAAQSAALGFSKAYKSMSAGEKVMVRAAFIQKNLGFATGQAMREADSFGTVMRAMAASAKGWGEQLGGPLIEPFKRAAILIMDVGDRIIPIAVDRLTELFSQTTTIEAAFNNFMDTVKRVGEVFLTQGWKAGVEELFGPDAVFMIEDVISILKSAKELLGAIAGGLFDSLIPAGGTTESLLSPLKQISIVLEFLAEHKGLLRSLVEFFASSVVPLLAFSGGISAISKALGGLTAAGKGVKTFSKDLRLIRDIGGDVASGYRRQNRRTRTRVSLFGKRVGVLKEKAGLMVDAAKTNVMTMPLMFQAGKVGMKHQSNQLFKKIKNANKMLVDKYRYVDGWLMMKQFHFEQDFAKGRRARSMKRDSWKQNKQVLKKEFEGKPGYWKARRDHLHGLDIQYGVGAGRRRFGRRMMTRAKIGKQAGVNLLTGSFKKLVTVLKNPKLIFGPFLNGLKAVFSVMRMNPLGLLITGITLLIGAFVAMYRNSEKLRNTLNGAWEVIKSAGAAAFQAIGSAMQWLWDNVAIPFMDWWGTTGGPGFSSAAQVAGDILADVLNNIGGVLMWLWHNVAEPAFGFMTDTAWPLLQAAFETAKPVVVEVLNAIGAGLQHAWAMGEGMFNQVKALADGIGGWFKAGWEAARPWLNNLINAMGEMGRNARMPGNMQSISDASAMTRAAMADSNPTSIQRGTGHIPHNAWGGPVKGMQPYIVGERGRELFVPETAGVIVPNHVLASPTRVGGGRSTQITVSLGEVHVGGRLSATEGDAVARDLAERVTREVVRKLRVAQAVG